jgi:hypothetical protein
MRVSPAKADISLDRVIAEDLTGVWLPCKESSAFQWRVQSNYPSKAEYVRRKLQCLVVHFLAANDDGHSGPVGTMRLTVGKYGSMQPRGAEIFPN